MKKSVLFATVALALMGQPALADEASGRLSQSLIATASNTAGNMLLLYSPTGALVKSIPTGGQGGVGGNSGGIAQSHERLAVVNFGSNNVSVFRKDEASGMLKLESLIPVAAGPVSVALTENHLYVLTAKSVESHPINERAGVMPQVDGTTALLIGDGSSAQVGVLPGQLIITEKSNAIETVNLGRNGAIGGNAVLARNIPATFNVPFGFVTRGFDTYISVAKSNAIGLVRQGTVVGVGSTGTQNAPCWLVLDGSFMFSTNTASHTVSRYIVSGNQIVQTVPVAASFSGGPTDMALVHHGKGGGLAAVIDNDGAVSHVTMFGVDANGNLTMQGRATVPAPKVNGAAIVNFGDD